MQKHLMFQLLQKKMLLNNYLTLEVKYSKY